MKMTLNSKYRPVENTENSERLKTSFPKEWVEIVDLNLY